MRRVNRLIPILFKRAIAAGSVIPNSRFDTPRRLSQSAIINLRSAENVLHDPTRLSAVDGNRSLMPGSTSMTHLPYLEFSPLEPNYLQHYRRHENGLTAWALENEATGEILASGIEETVTTARLRLEAAIETDLRRIAETFRG
jgi:hypothetical protein